MPVSGTALIIGGTGLVGRGVALELAAAGMQLVVAARGRISLPPELARHEFLPLDRSVVGALDGALGNRRFDVVVDCAAYTAADVTEVRAALEGRVGHYFFISSDFVYAADPAAKYPLTEDAATQTSLRYARNKMEAEAVLREAGRAISFAATVLRPPHVLGAGRPPGCDPAAGGRDAKLVNRLRTGEVIPLLAAGQFLIQPVWSREIGRCVAALEGNAGTFGGVYNLPGAECVTTFCYYEMLAAELGVPLKIRSVDLDGFRTANPDNAHQARHRIYDTRKLEAAGYRPSMSLAEAMAETVRDAGRK